MSATEGFWPGEAPSADEQEGMQDAVEKPEAEAAAAEPLSWPQPRDEEAEAEPEVAAVAEPEAVPEPEEEAQEEPEPQAAPAAVHAPGELDIPEAVAVLEGSPSGADRTVGVVVSRFNGEISNRLLESALEALASAGVADERITVMPVPGAFELPIGAMALAKTRRYSCVIALGCVVRGETAHFEYVAGEAASGLQLAGLETGVPVAFGVLTVDTAEQAEARVDRGGDAARAALEMADLFSQVRKQARAG
jgi:6,7-dimethyl-8-ribityllumazine synthase